MIVIAFLLSLATLFAAAAARVVVGKTTVSTGLATPSSSSSSGGSNSRRLSAEGGTPSSSYAEAPPVLHAGAGPHCIAVVEHRRHAAIDGGQHRRAQEYCIRAAIRGGILPQRHVYWWRRILLLPLLWICEYQYGGIRANYSLFVYAVVVVQMQIPHLGEYHWIYIETVALRWHVPVIQVLMLIV